MSLFQQISPLLSAAILIIWIISCYMVRGEIKTDLKTIGRRGAFVLALAVAAAAVMQSFCELKHLVYIDEFWYLEAGKNILRHGVADGFGKSIGWPVMIAFSYIFGGINNYSPIFLNVFLGLLCVPLMYLTARVITKNASAAGAAALILALLPYRAVWAASAETGIPSLLFILGGVYLSFIYYRSHSSRALFAASATWAMAAQMRPENLIFLGLFWAGRLLFTEKKDTDPDSRFYIFLIAAVLVNIPNFSVFAAFQSSTNWLEADSFGQLKGASISPANLWFNTIHWAPSFINLSLHGALFTLLFAAGAVWQLRTARKEFAFLAAWFGLLYCFYFSTWFHVYGTTTALFPKTKLFMLFYPVLAIWSGAALAEITARLKNGKLIAAAILTATLGWNAAYAPQSAFRSAPRALETRLLAGLVNTVPESCLIITNAPLTVTSASFFRTAYAPHFMADRNYAQDLLAGEPCLLYLDDITTELGVEEFVKTDRALKETYRLTPRAEFSLRDKTYRLFTVGKPLQAAMQPTATDY